MPLTYLRISISSAKEINYSLSPVMFAKKDKSQQAPQKKHI
jgi:hypothetical protein